MDQYERVGMMAGEADDDDNRSSSKSKGGDRVSDDKGRGGKSKKESGPRAAAKSFGQEMSRSSLESLRDLQGRDTRVRSDARPQTVDVPSFKRGGKKRKAGVARLHKGETIRRGGKRAKKGRE